MLMLTGVSLASCRAQSSAFIAGTDNISVLSTGQKWISPGNIDCFAGNLYRRIPPGIVAVSWESHPQALTEPYVNLSLAPPRRKNIIMALKEASHRTKPQAQQMMFNRAREQEHHELKRLETGWSYLLGNMVAGIGIGHGPDFSHRSGLSV